MNYICTSCNYVGQRKKVKPGSRTVEILLWTVLVIPGPFYSIWRMMFKHYACPQCGQRVMVAAISRKGRKIAEAIEDDISPENLKKIPFRWAKDVEEYNMKHGIVGKANQEQKEIIKEEILPATKKNDVVRKPELMFPQENEGKTDRNKDQW